MGMSWKNGVFYSHHFLKLKLLWGDITDSLWDCRPIIIIFFYKAKQIYLMILTVNIWNCHTKSIRLRTAISGKQKLSSKEETKYLPHTLWLDHEITKTRKSQMDHSGPEHNAPSDNCTYCWVKRFHYCRKSNKFHTYSNLQAY